MSEEDLGFEFQFTRPEMAYALNTIFDTINTLQSLKTPNKGKLKRIISNLIKLAMIIYADERGLIETQENFEQFIAQCELDDEEPQSIH